MRSYTYKNFFIAVRVSEETSGRYNVAGQVRASETDQVAAMSFVICQSFLSVDSAYAAGMKNAEKWVEQQ